MLCAQPQRLEARVDPNWSPLRLLWRSMLSAQVVLFFYRGLGVEWCYKDLMV
jgi:hypothetical protein